MVQTTVLISGANRGLGKGMLGLYLAKPSHTVIAFNRTPSDPSSKSLFDLPTGPGSKLIVLKCDSTVETDAHEAVKELEKQGVDHLDLVIANAAVAYRFPYVKDIKLADMMGHYEPNVLGVVALYQATRELLLKADKPIWVTMGSSAGCLTNQVPVPNSAYGPSKAAIHWVTKRLNAEEEGLVALVMDPGWVQTDMGNLGAVEYGLKEAPLSIKESITGMEKIFSEATKETHGGRLWRYNGEILEW